MDYSKLSDSELATNLQLEATRRDLLNEVSRSRQAEVTIAQYEMKDVQARAQAIMAEQEKRDAAKAEAARTTTATPAGTPLTATL